MIWQIDNRVIQTFLVGMGLWGTSACSTLGPTTVTGDRFNYNESLAKSSNEQLLLNIIRLRHGEPIHWLEVSSMLSQYTIEANANASAWRNDLNVITNPFLRAGLGVDGDPGEQSTIGGGVTYSDRPTISYAPLHGDEFARRILSPLPISELFYFVEAGWPVDQVFSTCVASINSLRNSQPHASGDPIPASPAFLELLKTLRDLQLAGKLHGVIESSSDGTELFFVTQSSASAAERAPVRELLGLSGDVGRLRLTAGPMSGDSVAIQTRSLLGILQAIAKSGVSAGESVDDGLTILTSRFPQSDAFVQIRRKGKWFHIADADERSKQMFSLLTYLYALQSTDVTKSSPMLSVPIGG